MTSRAFEPVTSPYILISREIYGRMDITLPPRSHDLESTNPLTPTKWYCWAAPMKTWKGVHPELSTSAGSVEGTWNGREVAGLFYISHFELSDSID